MDTDQQVRLDFLEEAEEYFDSLESLLMNLDSQGAEASLLDTAMRAAHSLKGGAAMMDFVSLSKIAHRLEDFLKILRVRRDDSLVDSEVTSLLLQSVDCLRTVRNLNQELSPIDEQWLANQTEPIFERLRQKLGDLKEEDEDLLLAEEEKIDVSTLIFESGVEDCLDYFRTQLDILTPTQLREDLGIQAEQLAEFGRMTHLDSFVQLCQSVQEKLKLVSLEEVKALADQAFKTWERSHALVLLGRIDQLPTQLETTANNFNPPNIPNAIDSSQLSAINFDFDQLALDAAELSDLGAAFSALESSPSETEPIVEQSLIDFDFDQLTLDAAELSDLSAAFSALESSPSETETIVEQSLSQNAIADLAVAQVPAKTSQDRMVRVSVEQLQSLNNLSSKLILERNTAILRLNQLQDFVGLTKERMRRLEQSSHQIRQLYDWASLEGVVSAKPATPATSTSWQASSSSATTAEFDSLEMDRYSDLHLLSQEQMETIVQLKEVTTDIDLGLQEMAQTVREFTYTTRELQKSITRSQMRPFSELVGRFPRFIRDLATKHHKQVSLKLEGETTLLDRQALELLGDPLNHLLRNAFDHGLEDPATRLAQGKPAEGEIILKAVQRGNQIIITISDDGAGINLEKICDRLIKMGLTPDQVQQIPDTELLDAIFEPGFSTAEQVTELSGRGVGMDVVRANLQQIRGEIKVETKLGQGTTFTIAVPLSLVVVRVAILESANLVFAVPVSSIKEIIQFDQELVFGKAHRNQEQINWHNQPLPLIRLEQWLSFQRLNKPFEMPGIPKVKVPTVLIFGEQQYQSIYIEKYWDESEVVIRPVETSIALFPGFNGSTVLGDGRVIPLIEPNALAKWIVKQKLIGFNTLTSTSASNLQLMHSHFIQTDKSTVLVVDDSVNVRRYLALTLEKNGYQVEQAKDGRDAVDKLLAGLQVDAVICDIEMPRLDGYGVLAEIKSKPNFENLPIAMLTSRTNAKHRQLAMKLGASAYFGKPFNEQEMLKTLENLISVKPRLVPHSRK